MVKITTATKELHENCSQIVHSQFKMLETFLKHFSTTVLYPKLTSKANLSFPWYMSWIIVSVLEFYKLKQF